MMDEKQMLEAVKRLMNKRYLEWQQKLQERKTITEFAEYLGFPQSTVSFWMNGARPIRKKEDIEQLALVIGFEIYDALGKERPDLDLHYIQANWEALDPNAKRILREQAERYAAQNKQRVENGQRRKPKPAG